MCIQETAGEGVSVSLSQFVEDSWRENKRSHFVRCILMEEKYSLFTRERQKFAKGISQEKAKIRKKYSLRKGKDSQKIFLKKRQSFAKVFSVF